MTRRFPPAGAVRSLLRRFRDCTAGAATVEFVIAVPLVTLMLSHGSEVGTILTRGAAIERGLDIAVRDLRTKGGAAAPTYEEFRQRMCDVNRTIPDCMEALQVELRPYSPTALTQMQNNPRCIDRSEDIVPVDETNFVPGVPNQIMLVRACAVFEPVFPKFGLGAVFPTDNAGNYRVSSISFYVQEP